MNSDDVVESLIGTPYPPKQYKYGKDMFREKYADAFFAAHPTENRETEFKVLLRNYKNDSILTQAGIEFSLYNKEHKEKVRLWSLANPNEAKIIDSKRKSESKSRRDRKEMHKAVKIMEETETDHMKKMRVPSANDPIFVERAETFVNHLLQVGVAVAEGVRAIHEHVRWIKAHDKKTDDRVAVAMGLATNHARNENDRGDLSNVDDGIEEEDEE